MRQAVFFGVLASTLALGSACGSDGDDDGDVLSGGSSPATTQGGAETGGGSDGDPGTSSGADGSTGPGSEESSGGETTEAMPPGDDHTHFDSECMKPGVVGCRSWRVQSEIDEDAHSSGNSIQPGDANYPVYDAEVDGARVPVIDGMGLAQLRYAFARVSGSVWVQYEMRLDAIVFSDPIFSGLGMKLWRAEDDTQAGCNDRRRITHNIGYGSESEIYHRDGCNVGEVRLEDAEGNIDLQPGGETSCMYKGTEPHPECFRWQGDTWIRFTYHFDFAGQMLHIWAFRADDDAPRKIVEFPVDGWEGNWGMDTAGVWTHSTSRGHGNWPVVPDFNLYGRNEIISTEEIAR